MGFKSIKMSRRGVYILDLKDKDDLIQSIYKVNYLSRIGNEFDFSYLFQGLRVLHPIIRCKPNTKEDFYNICKKSIKWSQYLSPETTFAIDSYIDPKSPSTFSLLPITNLYSFFQLSLRISSHERCNRRSNARHIRRS